MQSDGKKSNATKAKFLVQTNGRAGGCSTIVQNKREISHSYTQEKQPHGEYK